MRDRSLDEFASGDETAGDDAEETPADPTGETADTPAEDPADDDPTPTDSESPEPALSTYEWTPEGAVCARCEAVVEKRWRDGDGTGETLVCAACKDW